MHNIAATGSHRAPRAGTWALWRVCAAAAGLLALCSAPHAQVLIEFSSGLDNIRPSHDSPSYVAQHIALIESRPFDGMVVNDYIGRNLLSSRLKIDAPALLDPATGVVTYEAALHGLSPLKGVYTKFRYNFAKVNFSQTGPPPLLSDDAGWLRVYGAAATYSKAVADTGLRGIFFDNENYNHPPATQHAGTLDYWLYDDQLALASQASATLPFGQAVALARRRGRELMQAFVRGYPAITVIVAHSPGEGCSALRAVTAQYSDDHYLLGAFAAGMVEGTTGAATIVDGGEDYDLRSPREFTTSHDWRKGNGGTGVANVTGGARCPFMDATLAALWPSRVSVGFSTFDKERSSRRSGNWTPITDVAGFRATLGNALRTTDQYVWNYTQWQDWWGDTTESALKPWIDAINGARADAQAARTGH